MNTANSINAADSGDCVNVGKNERGLSMIVGALLALAGARRSWTAAAATLLGSVLALRGLTGRCALYRRLGISTAEGCPSEPEIETYVDRAVDDSFPASDPPSFAGGKVA